MLSPVKEERAEYSKSADEYGMKIDIEWVKTSWEFSDMRLMFFRGLSFTYPGKESSTLHDVNFHVEPGEVIAIVGPHIPYCRDLIEQLNRRQQDTTVRENPPF